MAVLASGVFTAWTWFDTDRELSKTNTILNNAQVSLIRTELVLAEVQTRLVEIQTAVADVSKKNLVLENTLLNIEIATKPKRNKVALAKEVREAALELTPRTEFSGGNAHINSNRNYLAWEIKNIGQSTVEVVLLELLIAEETPLLFNAMTRYRGARLYDEITGKLPSFSGKKYKSAQYVRASDNNLVPTAAFAFPSLISPDETIRMNLQFAIDNPKIGVTYHYRAIFGTRSEPGEIDYYLSVLEAEESTEAHLYNASRKLAFSIGAFNIVDTVKDLVTIDQFITGYGLNTEPNRVNIEITQHYLNKLGYQAGAVDGKLGPTTKAAISKFQGTQGIPASGELDIRTLTLVRNAMSNKTE